MAGRRVYGGSNMAVMLQNDVIPSSAEALDALLISSSSSTFHGGSRSMVNFDDVDGGKPTNRLFFQSFDQEELGEDDLDECFRQPEKKKRLTADQVQFLERNFELENKLGPERKIQLAKDLGLQPRQVAIWFQNRRARWKTKQLEKDYEALKVDFDNLKVEYDTLLMEKEKLKTEVLSLTEKLVLKGKGEENNESPYHDKAAHVQSQKSITGSNPEKKPSNLPAVVCKQEDLGSAKSDVFYSNSPHFTC